MDISDPSKLKDYEWGIVCAQFWYIQKDQVTPTVDKCNLPKMQKLLRASDGKCTKVDNSGSDVKVMCQSFSTMVRAFVHVNISVSQSSTRVTPRAQIYFHRRQA